MSGENINYWFFKARHILSFVLIALFLIFPILSFGQIVENCDPSLAPNDPTPPSGVGPCGVSAFLQTIRNIIKWFSRIMYPLGALLIGWGGFKIMTASGDPSKVNEGKKVMIIAITGIIIVLVSSLVVQGVFLILSARSEFIPTLTPAP
jgi:hypothetical protein